MEHLQAYYTLEKHLEESSKFNSQFEILNAIWKLNKKNLSKALNNVHQFFPHYSLHEQSHSNNIVNNIESFLGEKRIKRLSPTNTWLILMASFTHDLGMIVFQDLVEKEWLSEEFQTYLNGLKYNTDLDLKSSAEKLLIFQNITKEEPDNPDLQNITPIEIRNAVTLVVAEYMRKVHHQRSAEIIKGSNDVFYDLANSFYSDQIPKRLLNLLGEVAYLHGVDFYEIFTRLEFESDGISNDKINPRFIACMLRLGDLLDVDDNRFDLFTEKTFNFPSSSKLHMEKHSSIKHILINPEAIEITADCPSEEVYRLSRSWFDWLEEEVSHQSREWSNISPLDLGGTSPTIPRGKIKVYFNNEKVDDKLLNLRFNIDNKKIFEILEGASIYENAEFTFIRELVQNALDASKIQLWREIEKGTFDFAFKKEFGDHNLPHHKIIEKINFPEDIPELLYKSFDVELTLNWETEKKENLIIEVSDSGTGISNHDLLRMTNEVGQSRKKDRNYSSFLQNMPFWLRPTGAFGVGIQSIFIVSDNFTIQTKAEGEESKEIVFRSARNGKYSSLSNKKPEITKGTKVFVKIPKKRFSEIFGTSFDWNIIMEYDYFSDQHKSMHILKIEKYIHETLQKIPNLKVNFFGRTIIGENDVEITKHDFSSLISEDDEIKCQLLKINDNIQFNFTENKIGSEFILEIFPHYAFDIRNEWPAYSNEYFVRGIPVKDNTINYYKLSFSKLYWNFMSPESDKILSLTREKFIRKYKKKLESKFFADVIPSSLKMMDKIFQENITQIKNQFSEEEFQIIYFKILLLKSANDVGSLGDRNHNLLNKTCISQELAEKVSGEKLTHDEFFQYKKLIIPVYNFNSISNKTARSVKMEEIYKKFEDYNDSIIIWNPNFFHYYLLMKFKIKELFLYNDGKVLVLGDTKESIKLKVGEKLYYNRIIETPGLLKRGWYYSNQKYDKSISIKNSFASGFERFPFLSKKSIISPFGSKKEFIEFRAKMDSGNWEKSVTYNIVKELIPDSLIAWVKKYKPEEISERKTETIIEGYRKLIIDILKNAEFKSNKHT
ncbi:ATP-binding protein [Salegentibacter sp. Hel_I_6]|uniref:HD domain-containing protein n=1 Tax=Salegentibacter sp. Hel_I_6 TaxID=1250278 RepID=UPI00055E4125|nr:ATP-binding protein [Salegentibacter sp. Hel_I_6]